MGFPRKQQQRQALLILKPIIMILLIHSIRELHRILHMQFLTIGLNTTKPIHNQHDYSVVCTCIKEVRIKII